MHNTRDRFAKEDRVSSGESSKFELVLANRKSRTFRSGSDMYDWACHNSPKMDFKFDRTLSEWFESRRK